MRKMPSSPTAAVMGATLLLLMLVLQQTQAKNMNGEPGQYQIANGNPSSQAFQTDYAEDMEFFEVYSPPIRSRYSEVYWKAMDPVPLPEDILKRFQNKTLAITGYEVNQVIQNKDGEEDVPVPITHAYNHHYYAWIQNSQKARHVQKQATEEMLQAGYGYHGSNQYWTTEYLDENDEKNKKKHKKDDIPLVQVFSEGNGGEMRLSYHGYPHGYAQLIDSPDAFYIQPMQIDTWNRDEPGPKFQPGPLPKSSGIPASAGYSGLIECPCSDRLEKTWRMTYKMLDASKKSDTTCSSPIPNATDCWAGAKDLVAASHVRTHTDASEERPIGCSLEQHVVGAMDVYWNNPASSAGGDERKLAAVDEGEQQLSSSPPPTVAFATGQINVTVALQPANGNGPAASAAKNTATITMVGPADRWFGVGFGTNSMCLHMESDECTGGGPYAIIVSGDKIIERKVDHHGPGIELQQSVTIQSNTVVGTNRTVVLTRPLQGMDKNYFTFDPKIHKAVPVIMARGCSMMFAQHCGHGPAQLNFVALDTPIVICQDGIQGSIGGDGFAKNRCAEKPDSDLLAQKNPTCFVETYVGGLSCCKHSHPLLDKEQEIPWADQVLEYHLKFRFYFEEYQPALPTKDVQDKKKHPSHKNLQRLYRQTEFHAGEYDITACPESTPPSQCIQTITSQFKVRDTLYECPNLNCIDPPNVKGVEMIYAGPHCHAPSCISMELYHAETGQLLCHVEPIFGDSDDTIFNERSFLALPPCLWGSEEGLAKPVLLPLNATLLSIKRNNNTLPHTGEMASWQMRGHVVYKDEIIEGDQDEKATGNVYNEELVSLTKTAIRRGRREDV